EVVDETEARRDQHEDERPLEDLPRPLERRAQAESARHELGELRAGDDEDNRGEDEDGEPDGQQDRGKPLLPPRPLILDVIGTVERADQRDQRRRAAPERRQGAEGEQAAAVALCNLRQLLPDDLDHVRRRGAAQHVHHAADERGIGDEAGERDHEQQRGEEREEEVVGKLRRKAEPVVGARFLDGPLQELAPADRHVEMRKHVVCECKRAATRYSSAVVTGRTRGALRLPRQGRATTRSTPAATARTPLRVLAWSGLFGSTIWTVLQQTTTRRASRPGSSWPRVVVLLAGLVSFIAAPGAAQEAGAPLPP